MTLSPLGIDRLIVDGNSIVPREFRISWDSNDGVEVANFAGDIPVESTGANYFRYANKIYMSVPVCEKKDEKYSYKSYLYDVTDGLDKAVNVGETEAVITNDAITYMASVGSRPGEKGDTVIGVGDELTKKLQEKGISVVHDRSVYDVKNEKEERSKAYDYAAEAIEKYLKKYPSIKVVIDLHRDGVKESTKLVRRRTDRKWHRLCFLMGSAGPQATATLHI